LRELHQFYPSQNIVREINSRRMKWARPVVGISEEKSMYGILVGKT
jgi:hypothetical protein